MIYDLPTRLSLSDGEHEIRTDFRDILRILEAFEDPDLTPEMQQYICLFILYKDFEDLPRKLYQEAIEAANSFIDNGAEKNEKHSARTMDWSQDAHLIFPAVNAAAGCEVRSLPYCHWWTFTGYFMSIKDSVYATVLNIRQKRNKGKKLEQWEKDFWRDNKQICVLKEKLTEEEQAEKDRLNALL